MGMILVIDDDPAVLETLSANLKYVGHGVVSAHNGREGLAAVEEWHPDVVITDIVMPDMDGLELIRAVATPAHDPKIIAISGGGELGGRSGARDYLKFAMAFGADAVLAKPFRIHDLQAAVKQIYNP